MVGLIGVEPSTSRLSGVRSNQLSYRPIYHCEKQLSKLNRYEPVIISFPRKEVIHPHVPVGIPCYDFIPVTIFLLNPRGESSKNRSSRDLTGGECKEQGHIHGGMADPPLLAIPTSWSRVPDYNPN